MSFSLADSAVLSLIIYLVVDLIYFALDPRTRG
jgi:ABC-type dipeptide/oligopeptide/nickel transport system permease component